MELWQLEIYGIRLNVSYEIEKIRDIYGTGDSPTEYSIFIESVEIGQDNIKELLKESIMDEIESKLIQIEKEGDYDEWFN